MGRNLQAEPLKQDGLMVVGRLTQRLRIETPGRQVTLCINNRPWTGADEILSAPDADLFAAVTTSTVESNA